MKLFFNCKDACACCDKAQYEEASWFEKMRLRWHFYMCRSCKTHSEKNQKLTKLIDESNLCSKNTCGCKERLKQEIARELNQEAK